MICTITVQLLAGFLGQQSVERFRKPQLELAAVVLLACGLGDGDAYTAEQPRGGSSHYTFRLYAHHAAKAHTHEKSVYQFTPRMSHTRPRAWSISSLARAKVLTWWMGRFELCGLLQEGLDDVAEGQIRPLSEVIGQLRRHRNG